MVLKRMACQVKNLSFNKGQPHPPNSATLVGKTLGTGNKQEWTSMVLIQVRNQRIRILSSRIGIEPNIWRITSSLIGTILDRINITLMLMTIRSRKQLIQRPRILGMISRGSMGNRWRLRRRRRCKNQSWNFMELKENYQGTPGVPIIRFFQKLSHSHSHRITWK